MGDMSAEWTKANYATLTTDDGWTVTIHTGSKLRVKGLRGQFIFKQHVVTEKGNEWLDCYGPEGSQAMSRSFEIDRITKVEKALDENGEPIEKPRKRRRSKATVKPASRHGLPI
jgi:hypothetical protein